MIDAWAVALGFVFLACWVAVVIYSSSIHKAYTQGRIDQIRRKNRRTDYKGLPSVFYRRGRRAQAMHHRLKVRSRMAGQGYGNIIPR